MVLEEVMRKKYPSDISKEQFARIEVILESCKKKTKPRQVDLYEVFCGVLYVLKSGCQWRMIPQDLPNWRICYDYFQKWSWKSNKKTPSTLEVVLKKVSWRGATSPRSERKNEFLHN